MAKDYEEIYVPLGYDVSDAVKELLSYRKQGRLASMEFNGVTLYSDTVTMDDAYLKIVGRTKAEHDSSVKKWHENYDRRKKEHEARIPELTAYWIERGKEIIPEDRQELWARAVPVRLSDLYEGMELGNCLDIVKILNDGGTLDEAKKEIYKQDHSGMSFNLVCSMVRTFSDRGREFAEYVRL